MGSSLWPVPVRRRDISGNEFPPTYNGGIDAPQVLQLRPKYLEPPPDANHFLVSFSTTVAAGATTALFTLDGQGNPVDPSAAVVIPQNAQCRVSAVEIGGDAPLGAPTLFFSLRDRVGQRRYNGFSNVPLPGRGALFAVGFEPVVWVQDQQAFIGGWVENQGASGRYVEMFIQGWFFTV